MTARLEFIYLVKVKFYVIIIIGCLFCYGCDQYINPKEINIKQYEGAVKELTSKPNADSVFSNNSKSVSLLSFKKTAIAIFPKTYQLLKDSAAIEIRFQSANCLFIILKSHLGTFNLEREYLKIGNENQYKLGDTILRESVLANGWKYQLSSEYVAD